MRVKGTQSVRWSTTRIYYWLAEQIERLPWKRDSRIYRFEQIVVFESAARIATWLEDHRIVVLVADRANIEIGRCRPPFRKPACHAPKLIEVNGIHVDKRHSRIVVKGTRDNRLTELIVGRPEKKSEATGRGEGREARYMYPRAGKPSAVTFSTQNPTLSPPHPRAHRSSTTSTRRMSGHRPGRSSHLWSFFSHGDLTILDPHIRSTSYVA